MIDDGSTDQSLSLASGFLDYRIRIISDGENRGLVPRLNQSIALARGKYYARMDADDVMHPDRLGLQVEFLDTNTEVDVVDTAMYVMSQDGEITGIRKRDNLHNHTLWTLLSGKVLHHATAMGKIDWFKSNPYDPTYIRAEDYELWCRTFRKSQFAHIVHPLYYVREGKINVGNYRRSQKTARIVIWEYGYKNLELWKVIELVLATYFKEFIYAIMGSIGIQEMLTSTRNNKLNTADIQSAEATLKAVTSR